MWKVFPLAAKSVDFAKCRHFSPAELASQFKGRPLFATMAFQRDQSLKLCAISFCETPKKENDDVIIRGPLFIFRHCHIRKKLNIQSHRARGYECQILYEWHSREKIERASLSNVISLVSWHFWMRLSPRFLIASPPPLISTLSRRQ